MKNFSLQKCLIIMYEFLHGNAHMPFFDSLMNTEPLALFYIWQVDSGGEGGAAALAGGGCRGEAAALASLGSRWSRANAAR